MNENKIDAAIARLKKPEEDSNIFTVCDDYELLAQNGEEILSNALTMTCEYVTMAIMKRSATQEEAEAAIEAISRSPAVNRLVHSYIAFSKWHVAFAEQAAEVKEMMKSGLWTDDSTPSRN